MSETRPATDEEIEAVRRTINERGDDYRAGAFVIWALIARIDVECERADEAEAARWRLIPNAHTIHGPGVSSRRPAGLLEGLDETYQAAYEREKARAERAEAKLRRITAAGLADGAVIDVFEAAARDALAAQLAERDRRIAALEEGLEEAIDLAEACASRLDSYDRRTMDTDEMLAGLRALLSPAGEDQP